MTKKLYVGNLPFDATADELREMFSPYGRVLSATIATDRETGHSRGFGFVEMAEGAEEAIQALHRAVRRPEPDGERGQAPRGPAAGGGAGGTRGGRVAAARVLTGQLTDPAA